MDKTTDLRYIVSDIILYNSIAPSNELSDVTELADVTNNGINQYLQRP